MHAASSSGKSRPPPPMKTRSGGGEGRGGSLPGKGRGNPSLKKASHFPFPFLSQDSATGGEAARREFRRMERKGGFV